MAKLAELVPGALVGGLDPQGQVTVVSASQLGANAIELVYRNAAGEIASQMLFADDAERLVIGQKRRLWTFDGDGDELRLALEAWRIHYAHLFDPYLAVTTSSVEPLPHQIAAVYQEMLPRLPLRYVLADDPGAGKTIMTGLLIRELVARGDLARCLIVCPGSLAEQWQDELHRKFHLPFHILSRDRLENSLTGNGFQETNLAIARLDALARDERLLEKLKASEWDLIVCDEAHKMSASSSGDKVYKTLRYSLGELLSGICRHFLLLTATPHNGKESDFRLFLALIDQDRFGGVPGADGGSVNPGDVMRRLVKEELLRFDGTPLFPEREAISLHYSLSPGESDLYEAVTAYVQSQFNRADKLTGKRRVTVGFALTVLQRRLASSPEAIYQSLARRRQRLQKQLEEERQGKRQDDFVLDDNYDEDELTAEQLESQEEELSARASASTSIPELEAEIACLVELERHAARVRQAGTDRKWEELSGLLQTDLFRNRNEKLIIFTEHRDTLRYLEDKIASLLGDSRAVVVIHGSMPRGERHRVEASFKNDPETRILVATDAAGEGINLQRSHLMVNYDLPWNPNRLEQRFGRIHRIGQKHVCRLWNLVASQTREGRVFQRLFDKLEQEKASLGGKVFDILGKLSFENRPLRDLIINAVREDEKAPQINRIIDSALDREALLRLLAEEALTEDVMGSEAVAQMAEEMERMQARKLQPHYIATFFRDAFRRLGGRLTGREEGRFEVRRVPAILRTGQGGEPVSERYERICFDKAHVEGKIEADLICPGHPLLDAVVERQIAGSGDVLKSGAILINDNADDPECEPHLLFYVESALQDGTVTASGKRHEISRQIRFVEIYANGKVKDGGPAPYLDYRAATPEEQDALLAWSRGLEWLEGNVESRAMAYAAGELVPEHLAECRRHIIARLDKAEKAITERLTASIQYLDMRAAELDSRPGGGPGASQARNRAEQLAARLEKRRQELALQRQISAKTPLIRGGALVVPGSLVQSLVKGEEPGMYCPDPITRKQIENAAMQAVMEMEKSLGNEPRDVSDQKRGFDIESRTSDGHLRFIEVKGRVRGADSVTLTHNEVIFGLNAGENYILAIALVEPSERPAASGLVYLGKPFRNEPDFAMRQAAYDIDHLLKSAEVLYATP